MLGLSFYLHIKFKFPFSYVTNTSHLIFHSLEMAEEKGSHVETYLQLYFYWKLMDKGRRQYCFDGCWTWVLDHVLERNMTFWLFSVAALTIVSRTCLFTSASLMPNLIPTSGDSRATPPGWSWCRKLQ